jgi:hypothetical protein
MTDKQGRQYLCNKFMAAYPTSVKTSLTRFG